MIWLALRQSRAALLASAALSTVLAAMLITAGVRARNLGTLLLGTCASAPSSLVCRDLQARLWAQHQAIAPYLGYLTITTVLIATFWGAPMVAREVETGTAELAWCQSITRRRWLSYRLAVAAGCVGVLGLAAGWSVTFWLGSFTATSLGQGVYGAVWLQGPLLPAVWVCGLLIGVLIGTVARRAVPAMAVTAITTLILAIALNLMTSLYAVGAVGLRMLLVGQLWQTLPTVAVTVILTLAAYKRLARSGL